MEKLKGMWYLYHKKVIICGVSLIILVILGIVSIISNDNKLYAKEDIISSEEKTVEEVTTQKEFITLDVKGFVNKPGVYSLEKGSRVIDAINIAGGFKEGANSDVLNLSKVLSDEMVVIVYSIDEVNNAYKDDVNISMSKDDVYSYLKETYDSMIRDSIASLVESNAKLQVEEESKDDNKNDVININTATKEELLNIPYVGESKADDIINYRNENGSFKTIEELMNVSGIGQATFDKIKSSIKV